MGQYKHHVFVCTSGKTCSWQGGPEVHQAMKRAAHDAGLRGAVRINQAGCMNQCGHGPMVVVYPQDVWYGKVDEEGGARIVREQKEDAPLVARDRPEPPPPHRRSWHFQIEHHWLGPRVYFLGRRWHDWHLGGLVLVVLGLLVVTGVLRDRFVVVMVALIAVWLITKDWRDLTAKRRDTAAWRLGLHRIPHPLRTFRRADPLPLLTAIAAAVIGSRLRAIDVDRVRQINDAATASSDA